MYRRQIKRNYTRITKIAEKYGCQYVGNGFYKLGKHKIDLTASGDEDWAVAKNIIDQIK